MGVCYTQAHDRFSLGIERLWWRSKRRRDYLKLLATGEYKNRVIFLVNRWEQ
jgi:hypothetical protein